jgi:hypothetical protein
MLDLKPQPGTGTLLMLYGYFYLRPFTFGVADKISLHNNSSLNILLWRRSQSAPFEYGLLA